MAQNRVYEDFQPPHDWARDERSDTLILPLEGFSRNQLKVQITSGRKIRVSGERQVEGNKWRRFYIEFPAPQNSDTNDIGAKFERGTLYIRFPKLITPAVIPHQPPSDSKSSFSTSAAGATASAPVPKPTPREEPKAEQAIEKKAEAKDETRMEQKEKEAPKEKEEEKEDISKGKELKEEAKAPETEEYYKQVESRRKPSSLSERLSSLKAQDYKDAIVALVAETKKQKDVINKLVVVFVVLLLGLYLKHLVVSSFGESTKSNQEL